MLERNLLLVGRVTSQGEAVWSRGYLAGYELGKLYRTSPDLFEIHKGKILMDCTGGYGYIYDISLFRSLHVLVGNPVAKKLYAQDSDLKRHIKANAIAVAEIRDGEILWVEDTWALGMNQRSVRELWSRDISHFELLDDRVYFIKPKQEIVEELYFKCVEIAGSELGLAKSLVRAEAYSGNKKKRRREMMRNLAAFRRFSFARRDTFMRYVGLFTRYLRDHDMPTDGLFSRTLVQG